MQTTNQHNLKSDLIIGVDIGGTRTKYGLVNVATGEVVKNFVLPTERKVGAIFLEQIGAVIKDCRAFATQTDASILGIGFGIPGFTSHDGEVLTTYGFLEFMENYPLKTLIESNFQLPCLMDNDARIVCLGEALQAALILSESTKLNFNGLPMAQYDHGPKETAKNSIVIHILAKGKSYNRTKKLAETIEAAGAHCFFVVEPEVSENESVLNNIIPFNFLAYHLATRLNVLETFVVGGKVTEVSI